MDKSILKKFAIEQRKSLEEKVKDRLSIYYATEKDVDIKESGDTVNIKTDKGNNLVLSKIENEHRNRLKSRIEKIGINQVIEEASFTWFNRIIAIRYMELHDFLPLTKDNESLNIRVLSSSDGTSEPDIMKNQNLHNSELDLNIDFELLDKISNINDKYEKVLLSVCYKLGKVLPQIFDGETDYIDLLIPKNLLNKDSFLDKLINEVPEDNFNNIEIIGWFYQYYNQSEKDKAMKEKRAYKKTEIPYVTQIFTPDWIVKYMVENSLGRLWVEKNGDEEIIKEFKYFIKDNIEIDNKGIMPENITFIDPCMGSGHILVYAFEVFVKLYMQAGYNKKDIPEKILKNNLYGLDIDDRAGQFAIISIMLKAREYDKDIFNKIEFNKLNILSIQETDNYNDLLQCARSIREVDIRETAEYLIETFKNAKEIGSLLIVEDRDYDKLAKYLDAATSTVMNMLLRDSLKDVIRVAKILSKKYDVAVTNPPYLGIKKMSTGLISYIEKSTFIDYKYDLFACFIIKLLQLSNNGKIGMITQQALLNVDGYEKLRRFLIDNHHICNMLHLGSNAIDGGLGTVSFILSKTPVSNYFCTIKLDNYEDPNKKIEEFKNEDNKYIKNFEQIQIMPKYILAYEANNKILDLFKIENTIKDVSAVKSGLSTSDNDRFLRLWFEVDINKMCLSKQKNAKWFKHSKGGSYRKWYGNYEYVVNWENNGKEIIQYATELYTSYTRNVKNIKYYFCEGLFWTMTAFSSKFSLRMLPNDFIFNVESPALFEIKHKNYVFGLLNSIVGEAFVSLIRDSVHYKTKDIEKVPFIYNKAFENTINNTVSFCVDKSKTDWDSFETSWDFKKHPLI